MRPLSPGSARQRKKAINPMTGVLAGFSEWATRVASLRSADDAPLERSGDRSEAPREIAPRWALSQTLAVARSARAWLGSARRARADIANWVLRVGGGAS